MRRVLAVSIGIATLTTSLPQTGSAFTPLEKLNLAGPHQPPAARAPDKGIATVSIEDGTTVNMKCDTGQSPIVCTPTGSGAVLSVSDLENYLAQSSVTVTTDGTGGTQVADIDVVSPLSWSAATTLMLDADHSINVTSSIMVEGSGSSAGLSLIINDGGKHGYLTFAGGGYAEFAGTNNSLSINGAQYTLVESIADLAKGIAANPSGNFALAASVNAGSKTYKISPVVTSFYGSFEGLGNTISNLKIKDGSDTYIGLFEYVGGVVENLNLANVDVYVPKSNLNASYVGALAADSEPGASGAIPVLYNDTVSGVVSCPCVDVDVGGLVGLNGGKIIAALSSANVTSVMDFAGSLVGVNLGNGLGGDEGSISYSSASGAVAGNEAAGGLLGWLRGGTILHSSASGDVTFGDAQHLAYLGGLVGKFDDGDVSLSSATGNVTASQVGGVGGGLVGVDDSSGIVELSYAMGNVTGYGPANVYVGGLVGEMNYGEILNSYAMGATTCSLCTGRKKGIGAGGLTGLNGATIASSYATGLVTNGGPGKQCSKGCQYGGVTGFLKVGTYRFAYWDTQTTEQPLCTGNGNEPGCKGEITSQLQSKLPRGFGRKIWALNADINNGFPYLIDNPPP